MMVNRNIKTYTLDHQMNKKKLSLLSSFLDMWNSAMTLMKQDKIKDMKNGGGIRYFTKDEWDIFDPDIYNMRARTAKNMEAQLNGQLRSWQERAVDTGRKVINELNKERHFTDDELKRLRTINKSKKWWDDPTTTEIVHIVLQRSPFPVFRGCPTAVLDSITCKKQDSQNAVHFEQWLDISSLKDDGHVLVPLNISGYAQNKLNTGKELNSFQLKKVDGKITIKQCVEYSVSPEREEGKKIGVDWGILTLLTTSDGDLLGRSMYAWLKERDDELMSLQKRLKKHGIKLKDSQRYRNLQRRIREYVTNETNRILNKLAQDDTIETIVVEDLDFRGGGLSRKLNRIVSRAGRNAFTKKLNDLHVTHGIKTEKVNPAYTSQECNGCHYVDKKNRKGEYFHCKFCGKKIHADVSGSRNILRRSQDKSYLYMKKEDILKSLDTSFHNRWNIPVPV